MRFHAHLASGWRSGLVVTLVFLTTSPCWSQGPVKTGTPAERRDAISLPDAAVRALQSNLDISISRQTKESRLFDITIEQAKFDPTFSVNGQYNRQVSPLNRPVFGGTGGSLSDIQTFDQRNSSVTVDATQNLITGGNVDVNYSPARTNVNQNVATGFLFNPAYTGGLALTLTQPLLRNAGIDITKTFIKVAQNNADVEQHVFRDRVLTVLATVEQTYWELVFANENLKVAQAALKAAEELLATNRAKTKAGVMSIVDVLQAEAAVASRVEQVLVAEKSIRDQEDQLRRLLNPGEEELRQDVRLTPTDAPVVVLEPISLQEAIDTAIEQRPEIVQAKKNLESGELNKQFARNQLLPTLSLQGTLGMAGLGKDYGDSVSKNLSGDFYNYGAGLVLSYPLGNRSAVSTYNKRQLELKNAEASLVSVRQQIIVGVREAVRRVQTDFKRIETTRSARIMAEKQLQAEQERLKVGLSTTRFVLDFQRDLATAQGNELRSVVDYNKSLSNLARHKATTLDRYNLQLQ
ncbi:TolC family protein [Nitrospira lenta]|uniref:Putative Outer membrane efflux protein n=1 Tax=Nitrospira lenta TaxID=1436998 RepID=A0A330LFA6_9BACT|nr:TolC family protein [Nitrospira lenta]SPP65698.1 putative Outer membrane efflux protein [Nitrospira lenta]